MPTVKNTGKATMPKPTTPKPAPKPKPEPVPTPAPVPTPEPVSPSTGRHKQVITSKDVGVINASALIKSSVPIPAFLQQVAMPDTSNRQTTGYVGFAHPQSKNWVHMQQAGLEEGQPFVNHNNAYIPLDTVQFFLCMGASFQTMMAGKQGEFIFVTTDMDMRMDQVIYKGNACKLDPHYTCLLLVNLNGSLLPIKGDFRGTKSGGIENAIRAIEAAATPDWLKLSDQHKATAAFPQPFGRVWNEISTKRQISKSNGNPYHTAGCTCTPATVTQMQLLVTHLKDAEFQDSLAEAHTNYKARIDFLHNIMRGGNKVDSSGQVIATANNGNGSTNSQGVNVF